MKCAHACMSRVLPPHGTSLGLALVHQVGVPPYNSLDVCLHRCMLRVQLQLVTVHAHARAFTHLQLCNLVFAGSTQITKNQRYNCSKSSTHSSLSPFFEKCHQASFVCFAISRQSTRHPLIVLKHSKQRAWKPTATVACCWAIDQVKLRGP